MTIRKRISATTLAAAMAWGAFGLAAPASATTAQANEVSASSVDFPTNTTPKGTQLIGSRLDPGASMTETQYLGSPNLQHRIAADGWLANEVGLYLSSWSSTPQKISETGSRTDVNNLLVMQADGNLVLYSSGRPTWHSGTFGNPGAYAVLQDDSNLVVYSAGRRPLFSTNTTASDAFSVNVLGRTWESKLAPGWFLQSKDRRYRLLMQTDGNLVLSAGRRPIWHTGTNGNNGAYFRMQPDGNMVVYSASGRPLWASNTTRQGYNTFGLVLQTDGNMVEYQTSATNGYPVPVAIWSSRTKGRR